MKAYWCFAPTSVFVNPGSMGLSVFSSRFDKESLEKNPDPGLPHSYEPERPVPLDKVTTLGFLYWPIGTEGWESEVDRIAHEREYRLRDVIHVTKEELGNQYEDTLKYYFAEHMHDEEEPRYIMKGKGYWDIRDVQSDKWIRICIEAGDFIVLMPGMYHRFTPNTESGVTAMRLSKVTPNRIAFPRSAETDAAPCRQAYVRGLLGTA